MRTKDGFAMNAARMLVCLLAAVAVFAGCGGGSGDDNGVDTANVTKISEDTNPIAVGGATIVSVDFSFSSHDIFEDNQSVALVVFVPSALAYRNGTAEIDLPIGDDRGVTPQVFACADGTFFLFVLDDNDLLEADNPSGDADATLKFTLDAVGSSPGAVLQATARNDSVGFSCQTGLVADAVSSIVIS